MTSNLSKCTEYFEHYTMLHQDGVKFVKMHESYLSTIKFHYFCKIMFQFYSTAFGFSCHLLCNLSFSTFAKYLSMVLQNMFWYFFLLSFGLVATCFATCPTCKIWPRLRFSASGPSLTQAPRCSIDFECQILFKFWIRVPHQ